MTVFNYTSGDPNNLTASSSASMADIQGPFVDLKTFLNGRTLNEDNLPVSMLQRLGLGDSSGQKGRGVSFNATTGTRTNVAYGALNDAADQVTGLVVPTNALVEIGVFATWQNSVANAGRAAIFIGSNQLKVSDGSAAPVVQEASMTFATINADAVLTSMPTGINSPPMAAAYTGSVTTGQVLGQVNASPFNGGTFRIFNLAAGTYTISVQYKSATGSVTAKNRLLWAEVRAYA